MIDLQDIITTKRELLSRATCSLSPINYSAGDAVVLYERNTDTDNVTNKMVFKGNIIMKILSLQK